MSAWLDGELVARAAISADDRGFLLADGVFATILVRAKKPLFLRAHMERLRAGLAYLAIPTPYDDAAILKAISELCDTNGLGTDDAVARVTITRGGGVRGLAPPARAEAKPLTLVALAPAPPPYGAPPEAIIVSVRRNEKNESSRLKTLSYTDNIAALMEARSEGGDEAVMLNGDGRLACLSAANIFAFEGQTLRTPQPEEGCRPGVARHIILTLARGLGLGVAEEPVSADRLEGSLVFGANAVRGPFEVKVRGAKGGGAEERDAFAALSKAYSTRLAEEAEG